MKVASWAMAALAGLVAVSSLPTGGAIAMEVDLKPIGAEQLASASLTAPGSLVAVNGGCSSTSPQQNNVSLGWTDSQSGAADAADGYLVSGYSVQRSAASGGTSASVAVGGTPPPASAMDNPPAAPAESILLADGTAKGSDRAYSVSESSQSVVSSAAIGEAGQEPNAIQITPDGEEAVIAESLSKQVQVLTSSGGSWTVAKTLALADPIAVAIDPIPADGLYTAYVVSDAGSGQAGSVYPLQLDGASSSLGSAYRVGDQVDPTAIAVAPNGSAVFVADYGSHAVSSIDLTTSTVDQIALPGVNPAPVALAVTPDSGHVYVADRNNSAIDDLSASADDLVAAIALPTGSLDDTILTGAGNPDVMAINPAGTELYVAEFGAARVQEVNTALSATSPDTVSASISTGTGSEPIDVALSPNGCLLYVPDWPSNDIFVVHTATDAESTVFTTTCWTQDPQPVQVTADNTYLVIPENYSCGDAQLLDTASGQITTIANTAVGNYPTLVAAPPVLYDYSVVATHDQWSSSPSGTVAYSLGWNPGGWQ